MSIEFGLLKVNSVLLLAVVGSLDSLQLDKHWPMVCEFNRDGENNTDDDDDDDDNDDGVRGDGDVSLKFNSSLVELFKWWYEFFNGNGDVARSNIGWFERDESEGLINAEDLPV